MAPVILVTFAGRQKRMRVLTEYVRRAMELGIIDQWHIWDFTRSPEDHEWVTREFGPVRWMADKAPYETLGTLTSRSHFRASAAIAHDLHIGVLPHDDPDSFFEIVVGGWDNKASALRKSPRSDMAHFERKDAVNLWMRSTPGVLSPGVPNSIVIALDGAGVPSLFVNDVLVGQWPELNWSAGATVTMRGGWGCDLELCDTHAPVQRYIGSPNVRMPYWQAYNYYARRVSDFQNAIFLKCDDDIVYLDIESLSDFIQFRRQNPKYFLVSANVVNNGVCAFWQQEAGSLPTSLGHFERPPGGKEGSLWQSGEKAAQLHQYFLASDSKRLPFPTPVIEWSERQSINFIAWLGRDIVHMALPPGDDEHFLSVELAAFLGRQNAIYSDFTVSHLSFGRQENDADFDALADDYHELMRETLDRQI